MNPIEILEKFGIPVTVAMAFGFFIWKQNKYIQEDLTKDIHNKFNRLEDIINADLRAIIVARINIILKLMKDKENKDV